MNAAEPELITIEEVRDRGWLGEVFQGVTDELIAHPIKRVSLGNKLPKSDISFDADLGDPRSVEKLFRAYDECEKCDPDEAIRIDAKFNDPRYPPASPEEIVEIFEEARKFPQGGSGAVGTMLLAEKLKTVVAQKLLDTGYGAYFIV
ncbi:MAG: hypothetical protein DI551_02390 [Micavibrio aeruginosavorus]|uniref:Uncharacterized protein n=1 Tax=Micavibrio aeruginosavorus TaxID=349221 RepID=A0A2W5N4M0_9BACT|nr:MAG: hypothetical protein DI551_02390 [Micavibrio aeruginosavorus]